MSPGLVAMVILIAEAQVGSLIPSQEDNCLKSIINCTKYIWISIYLI